MYKALSKITKKIVCKVVISMVLQSNAHTYKDFPGGSAVKNSPANAGDTGDAGSIPGSGRSPRGGHGNPLQYLAWRNPWTEEPSMLQSMRSWKSWTQLSKLNENTTTTSVLPAGSISVSQFDTLGFPRWH